MGQAGLQQQITPHISRFTIPSAFLAPEVGIVRQLLQTEDDFGQEGGEGGVVGNAHQRFQAHVLEHELPLGEELSREVFEQRLLDLLAALPEAAQFGGGQERRYAQEEFWR